MSNQPPSKPDRFACLDQAHIEDMALQASMQLATRGYAEVLLTPGDATKYPVVVLPAKRVAAATYGNEVQREYLVVLAASFGRSYAWTGDGGMHGSYCDHKWCIDGNGWTGEVIARFLNALSPYVERVT